MIAVSPPKSSARGRSSDHERNPPEADAPVRQFGQRRQRGQSRQFGHNAYTYDPACPATLLRGRMRGLPLPLKMSFSAADVRTIVLTCLGMRKLPTVTRPLSRGYARGALAFVAAMGVLFGLLVSVPAAAGDRVARLADQLADAEDFRVRTQAALALGASADKRALEPLCEALEDSNTTVRAASAAALGKLRMGGEECLSDQLEDESNASVKSVIRKSLGKLKGGGSKKLGASSKYYIAIGKLKDKSGRAGGDLDKMVRQAMLAAIDGLDGFVVAPESESSSQAKKILKKHKNVTAFYLWPKLKKPTYTGGKLSIKISLSIFSYPGKALMGMTSTKLSMPGVSKGDEDSEDFLIKACAEKVLQKFSSSAGSIR